MISRGDFWFNKKAYWNKCDGGGDNQIKGAPRWTWHWMLRKNKWQIKMQIKRKNRKGTKRGTDKSSPRPETSTQCTLFRGTLAHWSKKKTKQNRKQNKMVWLHGGLLACVCAALSPFENGPMTSSDLPFGMPKSEKCKTATVSSTGVRQHDFVCNIN